MTETLNGKQVLALLAQDEPPEIEWSCTANVWSAFIPSDWHVSTMLRRNGNNFRIKPTPQRRLSVTLASGEVVSWPEPVREALAKGTEFWSVDVDGVVFVSLWENSTDDKSVLAFGNVHLTREAAQEHADALKKINTQGVVC